MKLSWQGDVFCGDQFALEKLRSSHVVFALDLWDTKALEKAPPKLRLFPNSARRFVHFDSGLRNDNKDRTFSRTMFVLSTWKEPVHMV